MKKLTEYGKRFTPNKDFIRTDLMELYSAIGEYAILITGKLVFTSANKHVTFGNIRVFDEADHEKTKFQLTDHVNFRRDIVERYVDLCQEMNHKKFFAVCTPHTYLYNGVIRAGLGLVELNGETPIIRAPEIRWMWQKELERLIQLRDLFNKQIS